MKVWEDFYDQTFARHLLCGPRPGEVEFLLRHLRVEPPARIFDQCCGNGRISRLLHQRGFTLVGVDITASYIEEAGLAGLRVGDAAHFRPDEVAGAYNLYSSFGYSESDATNGELLRRVGESLPGGGRFILDTHNPGAILSNFQELIRSDVGEGLTLERESRWDAVAGMLRQRWLYTFSDGRRRERWGDCKMYQPHELTRLLELAGMRPVGWYGGFADEPLERLSPRLIVVAEKSA